MFDRIDKSYDKDSLQTPKYLFNWLNEKYSFEIDLAASSENNLCDEYLTESDNSHTGNWREWGRVGFCNPPYSRGKIQPFIDTAIKESQDCFTSVFLIPELNGEARTKDILIHATNIIHFDQRIWFIHPITGKECKNNNRGSIVVEFSYKPFYKPPQHYFISLSEIKDKWSEL